jgi:hypothetical protein
MTKTTPFWQSVRELAAMRGHIPEERREMSGVRDAVRLDVRAKSGSSSNDRDEHQNVRGR